MNPKTQQTVKDIVSTYNSTGMAFRIGVVVAYDEENNTATVIVTKEQSDEIDEVLEKVMCPRTLGIQTVAPTPGLQCLVIFKDNNVTQPLITHFFNHRYNKFDYPKQVRATNNLPYYLLGS